MVLVDSWWCFGNIEGREGRRIGECDGCAGPVEDLLFLVIVSEAAFLVGVVFPPRQTDRLHR